MLTVEPEWLLLQVGATRLRIRTQPLTLLLERTLFCLLLRARGVVGGTRLVQAVGQGQSAAGEREVVPARLVERAFGFTGVRAGGRFEQVEVAAPPVVVVAAPLLVEQRCQRLQ